jgi:hypothetical protein
MLAPARAVPEDAAPENRAASMKAAMGPLGTPYPRPLGLLLLNVEACGAIMKSKSKLRTEAQ